MKFVTYSFSVELCVSVRVDSVRLPGSTATCCLGQRGVLPGDSSALPGDSCALPGDSSVSVHCLCRLRLEEGIGTSSSIDQRLHQRTPLSVHEHRGFMASLTVPVSGSFSCHELGHGGSRGRKRGRSRLKNVEIWAHMSEERTVPLIAFIF